MIAATLPPGLAGCDTFDVTTRAGLAPLTEWRKRFSWIARYLGNLTTSELGALLAADMRVVLVTFANHFDPQEALTHLRRLAVPAGGPNPPTVFLDVEGITTIAAGDLVGKINLWAATIAAAGYMPGLYVADRHLLTSRELFALRVVRYWRGAARIVDRFGALAEPDCGWCIEQGRPGNASFGGTRVDFDASTEDYRGRSAVALAAA